MHGEVVGGAPRLDCVNDIDAARERLAKGDIDVVMLVVQNASRLAERLEPIAHLRKANIGVTAGANRLRTYERATNQILQSAPDYLVKDQLSPGSLMHAIR